MTSAMANLKSQSTIYNIGLVHVGHQPFFSIEYCTVSYTLIFRSNHQWFKGKVALLTLSGQAKYRSIFVRVRIGLSRFPTPPHSPQGYPRRLSRRQCDNTLGIYSPSESQAS